MDPLTSAARIADAVLREGHVLYPYRPSALKNRMRWQFGVLGPPALAHRPGADGATCRTELVTDAEDLVVRARGLRVVDTAGDDDSWQQTELVEIDGGVGRTEFPGGELVVERLGPFVSITVANTDAFADPTATRSAVLEHSLIAVHVVVGARDDGVFASATDPPEELAALVAACRHDRLWPVLVGRGAVLACPIILYDQPELAPESIGDLGDATEIEELLALRIRTLTDEERAAATATDPFAAAAMSRAEHADLTSLHGRLAVGSSVVLRPRPGADAHDLFLDGRRATVVGHAVDVDGTSYVKVIPDDDPGRDLHEWFGRSWFFRPDEVEQP